MGGRQTRKDHIQKNEVNITRNNTRSLGKEYTFKAVQH